MHSHHFNTKPPHVKVNIKMQSKITKGPGGHNVLGDDTRPFNGTIDLDVGNKEVFTYPFIMPKENDMSHFIMNLKPLN